MEILFLNTLNGKIREPIIEFLTPYAHTADVLCLQEVYETSYNMQATCRRLLPEFQSTFAFKPIEGDDFAQATYVHPRIRVLNTQIVFPHDRSIGLGIVTTVEHRGNPLHICNFHGRSKPGHKLDTPERLKQTREIIELFANREGEKIIGGDFNADISSRTVLDLEVAGYTNLIRRHEIRTTRNRIAWEAYPLTPQFHSDYIFISSGIKVRRFKVIENEVSDHLPMVLEIN
jgi:endonuclease/exonuclease/phosphatase family metal-dependent hydrolase